MAVPSNAFFCMLVYLVIGLRADFGLFWLAYLLCLLTSIGASFTFATVGGSAGRGAGRVWGGRGWGR